MQITFYIDLASSHFTKSLVCLIFLYIDPPIFKVIVNTEKFIPFQFSHFITFPAYIRAHNAVLNGNIRRYFLALGFINCILI